jgi:Uma2 family endonuclease
MSTVLEPRSAGGQRLLTVADLAALPADLPSGSVKYELDDGRLVLMAPPGDDHGRIQSRVVIALFKYMESLGLGECRGEIGVILRRNPDRVVGPDAAFIANCSLPVRTSPEGYLETIPELVVEVRSKNDTLPELRDKVAEYLAAGVQIVWVVNPRSKTVSVFRLGQDSSELRIGDVLTAEGAIPGFQAPVAELFDQ